MMTEAAAAERRRRADDAPRLSSAAPTLVSMRLEIEIFRDGVPLSNSKHIRRIVVSDAPALFELPCLDGFCREGGHDITRALLNGLSQRSQRFRGEEECSGRTGSAYCRCVMHFVAVAEYA
jgi:hypothetical protein